MGSFEACLATVMEVDILFLHKVVQNSPKYPLLKGIDDNLIWSKDKWPFNQLPFHLASTMLFKWVEGHKK